MGHRKPRFIPAMGLLIGLGIAGYYGLAWYELPRWNEQEINQSVELNLAMDVARMGPHLKPQGEKLERLRAQMRTEVEGDIRRELKTIQLRLSIGLMAIVIGLAQLITAALIRRFWSDRYPIKEQPQ